MAAESNDGETAAVDASKLMQGSVYQGVMRSGARKFIKVYFELNNYTTVLCTVVKMSVED